MIQKKAFTLFEVVVALAISALVAMGLFSMLFAVTGMRDSSVSQSENILIIQAITKLINKDTRMMVDGSLGVDAIDDIRKLKFTTQNSLRFNKTVTADIIYYVEDGWLIRRETNTQLLYDMEMKLIPNITDMTLEFFNGNEYKDEVSAGAKIFRITLTINNSPITILAARTVDNT